MPTHKHTHRWWQTWREHHLAVIAIAVLVWLLVVSVLDVRLNHGRRDVAGTTPAATVEVGGLPVT